MFKFRTPISLRATAACTGGCWVSRTTPCTGGYWVSRTTSPNPSIPNPCCSIARDREIRRWRAVEPWARIESRIVRAVGIGGFAADTAPHQVSAMGRAPKSRTGPCRSVLRGLARRGPRPTCRLAMNSLRSRQADKAQDPGGGHYRR